MLDIERYAYIENMIPEWAYELNTVSVACSVTILVVTPLGLKVVYSQRRTQCVNVTFGSGNVNAPTGCL